jgi:hypothetical protein
MWLSQSPLAAPSFVKHWPVQYRRDIFLQRCVWGKQHEPASKSEMTVHRMDDCNKLAMLQRCAHAWLKRLVAPMTMTPSLMERA